MNKIIVFIKGLLQLSTILVGIFGLFLFIGGGWLYHDLQYRYVVDSRYNTIFVILTPIFNFPNTALALPNAASILS